MKARLVSLNASMKWAMAILILLSMQVAKAGPTDSAPYTVYVFLLETCPICQSATPELIKLYQDYSKQGVEFVGLFPNGKMSNEGTIEQFNAKYKLPFELRLDTDQEIAQSLGATITPQVYVVRNSDKQILYSGRIDNSFESLGKRRRVVTEHNLAQALENIIQSKPAVPAQTDAVGCFISKL